MLTWNQDLVAASAMELVASYTKVLVLSLFSSIKLPWHRVYFLMYPCCVAGYQNGAGYLADS